MPKIIRDTLSDEMLMSRFVWHNDRNSYEDIVKRWDRPIFAFLAKASGDAEAAKDLRQEVFLRVYKYATTYDSNQKFSTWLFSIARNVLATWHAKKTRASLIPISNSFGNTMSAVDPSKDPAARAVADESKDQVNDVMARLTPYERELLLLRMDQGLSYREIAEILDTPETTIKSRTYALLTRIRKDMERQFKTHELETLKHCERM